ncbi:MAG: hypothetical protein GYB20_01855 [Oceanospirillales bacterium]|nr:hypothetical protein [Oceanospirillales bacterium]
MSDFSMFDLDLSSKPGYTLPDWSEFQGSKSNTAEAMYRYVLEARDAIKIQLANGVDLRGKAKKIVLSNVSESVGKNADYLNKREFPTIVRFINELNDQLARLQPVGCEPPPKSNISTVELKRRVKELEKQQKENNFSQLLTDRVIAQLGPLRQRNIKLEQENRELSESLLKERDQSAALIDQVSELLAEIYALNNRIRSLGHEPDPNTKMAIVKRDGKRSSESPSEL